MVVREDGPRLPSRCAQFPTGGTEIVRGGQCGVIDAERVGDPIAVAVDRVPGPGGRDELHRPHRTVEDRVAVQAAGIGVADQRGSYSVERNSDDLGSRCAIDVQYGAAESPVVGLDASDGSQ